MRGSRAKVAPGEKYGMLTIIAEAPRRKWDTRAVCECECGSVREYRFCEVRLGIIESCGCGRFTPEKRAIISDQFTKHGFCKGREHTAEYRIWAGIKTRCFNQNKREYRWYGALGITIYPEWENNFPAFLSYVGPRPSPLHSIDRINSAGNYEPGNIRWVTWDMQVKNRRKKGTVTRCP
jgi:hypothetical protein